jgi:hypothetical protein
LTPSSGLKIEAVCFSWLKMEVVCPSETLVPTNRQDVITQKTNIDIFTAVRTSNLIRVSVSKVWKVKTQKSGKNI